MNKKVNCSSILKRKNLNYSNVHQQPFVSRSSAIKERNGAAMEVENFFLFKIEEKKIACLNAEE